MHLATQHVEELRSCRGVHNLNVVLGTQSQEAFDTRRTVFGALAFVTVWQQHDESVVLPPLVFGGHQILVDDDLRSVNEVTKLCFPQNQCFRIGMGIAVFKTKRGILAE